MHPHGRTCRWVAGIKKVTHRILITFLFIYDVIDITALLQARRQASPALAGLELSYIIGACKGHTASATGCGPTTVNETEQMMAIVRQLEIDGVVRDHEQER